jgi:hypothetical protein
LTAFKVTFHTGKGYFFLFAPFPIPFISLLSFFSVFLPSYLILTTCSTSSIVLLALTKVPKVGALRLDRTSPSATVKNQGCTVTKVSWIVVLPNSVSSLDRASHHLVSSVARHDPKGKAEAKGAASGQLSQQLNRAVRLITSSRHTVRALLESHSELGKGQKNPWLSSVVALSPGFQHGGTAR